MSKLAHSNQETMDDLDHRRAIKNGDEDLIPAQTAKHTPGPWEVDGRDIRSANGIGVAYCGANSEANSRLIAAAPKMLEALKGLQFAIQHLIGGMDADDLTAYDVARAVISEAEGK